MPVRFIHTADWQIGKPFAWVSDPDKRLILQRKRIDAIKRIADEVNSHKASFVVVAGDLFDSPTPTKSLVSEVCSLIGKIDAPVFVIPGNHDHGGPLGLWDKEFFLQERGTLATNLKVLMDYKPHEIDQAIIMPCPLLKRHERLDPTTWLRNHVEAFEGLPEDKPRIVIAHGSVQDFGGVPDEDEGEMTLTANRLELEKLPMDKLDYVALGDWHGTKAVNSKAWYSGTPELDRFNKGGAYDPGNILLVEASRGETPSVKKLNTSNTRWQEIEFEIGGENDIELLKSRVEELVRSDVNRDLMKLILKGSTGMEGFAMLDGFYETWNSRFLSLRVESEVVIQPTKEELERLTEDAEDPLTAQVAKRLFDMTQTGSSQVEAARLALRLLFLASKSNQKN
jgi:DNA repair exonuclease SbcCD nuclease subunit